MSKIALDIDATEQPNFGAISPFIVFMVFYLGLSILCHDFYKVSMPISFIVASAVAMCQNRKHSLGDKVEVFAHGMGDVNIMIMCMIFILAGAFATVAKQMGAVDAAVVIARNLVPVKYMVIGMFVVSCFISLAIGTSCGTIAALTPIGVGLVQQLGIAPEIMISAIIGGAMFGDNLSMISDTTIAATRTQDVAMRDKFITNLRIVIPAVIVTLMIYFCIANSKSDISSVASGLVSQRIGAHEILMVLPYVLILVCALLGLNVMMLLFLGTVLASVIGICVGKVDFWGCMGAAGNGCLGMAETLIVAILAGGLMKVIRWNGGISWVMQKIEGAVHSVCGCEFGIMLLVCLVNLFTANNTVAIVIAGPIARTMSEKFGCDPRRIASILDTTSCVVQGAIAYGAQILIAAGLCKESGIAVAPLSLVGALYYPMVMCVFLILFIVIGTSKKSIAKN